MVDQRRELSEEERIKKVGELNKKRDKVMANIEEYVGAKCKKILLLAQREDNVIMDIPMKGLPNFADEKLLMTELIEANLTLRVIRGLEHKVQVMVNKGTAEISAAIKELGDIAAKAKKK